MEETEPKRREGPFFAVLDFCRRYPLGAVGGVILFIMVFFAIFANVVATRDPVTTNTDKTLLPPGTEYILGTDYLGRDLYARIVHGARISLMVGLCSTLLGGSIGMVIGLLSGYLLGWWDLVTQRLMDIMQGLPLLVMALVMSAALGPSLKNTVLAISIPLIPRVARVVRSSTLAIREMTFVEAAHAVGMSQKRIAFLHVLPNTMAPFIVMTTAQLGSAILVEASLSYLGLGIPEPYPSWGRMLTEAAAEYALQAPWLVIFPGIAISLAVFGANLMGDALRDSLDPRLRQ
ncbi:MAG: ABC transporter permease [Pseudomonadota bacterium]